MKLGKEVQVGEGDPWVQWYCRSSKAWRRRRFVQLSLSLNIFYTVVLIEFQLINHTIQVMIYFRTATIVSADDINDFDTLEEEDGET